MDALLVWRIERHPSVFLAKNGEITTDIVTKLTTQISNSSDTTEIYSLYQTLIDTLQQRFDSDTTDTYVLSNLARAYGGKSWYALFLRQFAAAEAAGLKGLALDASQVFIKTNLGHALLFQDKYKAAL